MNEAALLAARIGKRVVAMAEFENAKDKVMMGTERRSLVMTEAEKRMTAYHEGGHALCAMHEPECDPVHKATIIPRGRALGLVMSLPEGDRYSKSKSKLLAELTMAMGGRAAEEIIFGADKVSNGAAGDIKMATDQARRMITEWGMSDKLGMIAYGDNSQEVFLGHSVTQNKNVSEATAREIDAEIKDIIDDAYAQGAAHPDRERRGTAPRWRAGCWNTRRCRGDEIRTVLRGEPVIRKVVDEPAPESRRASVPTAGRPLPAAAGGLGAGAAAGLTGAVRPDRAAGVCCYGAAAAEAVARGRRAPGWPAGLRPSRSCDWRRAARSFPIRDLPRGLSPALARISAAPAALGRAADWRGPPSWASSTSPPTVSATAALHADRERAIAAGRAMAAAGADIDRRRRREHPARRRADPAGRRSRRASCR